MKLKKKMLTVYIQRVKAPQGVTLTEYNTFYTKLTAKYGDNANLKIIRRMHGYSTGGYWLVERRMETNDELAKRQAILDKVIAKRRAIQEARKAKRKVEQAAYKADQKKRDSALKEAKLHREVENIKTMVAALKLAGYSVSANR